MSSRSVNCIYPFEFFHQMHIFCSKDLSRSATTLYGYYVCSCNFGTTRLLHARFLYSAYVLSNHISKLYSYLLSGFLSNFNTCSLGSVNPSRVVRRRRRDELGGRRRSVARRQRRGAGGPARRLIHQQAEVVQGPCRGLLLQRLLPQRNQEGGRGRRA